MITEEHKMEQLKWAVEAEDDNFPAYNLDSLSGAPDEEKNYYYGNHPIKITLSTEPGEVESVVLTNYEAQDELQKFLNRLEPASAQVWMTRMKGNDNVSIL